MADNEQQLIKLPTDAEYQDEINRALEPLVGQIPSVDNFTVQSITECNLTVKDFCSACRGLASYATQGILEKLISAANVAGIVKSIYQFGSKDMFDVAQWVKTAAGKEIVVSITTTRKLERRAHPGSSASNMAWLSIFTQMQSEHSRLIKKEKNRCARKAAEYRQKIDLLEQASAERCAAINSNYPALNEFVDIPRTDMVNRCWQAYIFDCNTKGVPAKGKNQQNIVQAIQEFGHKVRELHAEEFCRRPEVQRALEAFAHQKIAGLSSERTPNDVETFDATLLQQLEDKLLSLPLPLRRQHLQLVPIGKPLTTGITPKSMPLSIMCSGKDLLKKRMLGMTLKPLLTVKAELRKDPGNRLETNRRLGIIREVRPDPTRVIARARSSWEAGVRRVIGGGEMRNFHEANAMYRGGGNMFDALRLLCNADESDDYMRFSGRTTEAQARAFLRLPQGLGVPDGRDCCCIKHFNHDASAGPSFRAFGIKKKNGLKLLLENYAWEVYDGIGNGNEPSTIPFMMSRLGYRTKLVTLEKAYQKLSSGDSIGRAVLMLDAHEQAFSSPIFNVISKVVSDLHKQPGTGWRNYLIRASSDWGRLFSEVKRAETVVELDWAKFDRERPADHISFFIDVIMSCFTARSPREKQLLRGYRMGMVRALLERLIVTDDGGIIEIDGMIPSGSLWTGLLGTGLNILYIHIALVSLGFHSGEFEVICAGDDNLTLFKERQSLERMERFRVALNSMFRANIKTEDFIVHYPPYHVGRVQAVFPPGTDLSKGTSKILNLCRWEEIRGEPVIDEAAGRSHRWEYRFSGKPKFLANYFLPDGRCVRPAAESLERLLWPEGIQKTLDDYEMSLLAMVVDNPFNSHNVNHMMHRYCIVQQVRKQATLGINPEDIIWYSGLRGGKDDLIPYPMIAYWRRQDKKVYMEQCDDLSVYIDQFKAFVAGVTTLYGRQASGGMDAWLFMSILKGERDLGEGQFGNDIVDWCSFLHHNPAAKGLRAARRFRVEEVERPDVPKVTQQFMHMQRGLQEARDAGLFGSAETFAKFLSQLYCKQLI
nr:ORF1+ORF2 fusion protein [Aconitum amalgavirus 1]